MIVGLISAIVAFACSVVAGIAILVKELDAGSKADFVLAWSILFMSGLFFAGWVSASWRQEATEKGHAEYYLDKDNERQWRWKEIKKE